MYSQANSSLKAVNKDIKNYSWEMFINDFNENSQRLQDIQAYCM